MTLVKFMTMCQINKYIASSLFSTFIFTITGSYWCYMIFINFYLFLIIEIYSFLLNHFLLIKIILPRYGDFMFLRQSPGVPHRPLKLAAQLPHVHCIPRA